MTVKGVGVWLRLGRERRFFWWLWGMVVAIDGMAWMHRARNRNKVALALGWKSNLDQEWVLGKLRELVLRFGVARIYFIVDGRQSEAKKSEDLRRATLRKAKIAQGLALLKARSLSKAKSYLMAGTMITKKDKEDLMRRIANDPTLQGRVIPFFSPNQTDSQIAGMIIAGKIDAAFADDLDIISPVCENILARVSFLTYTAQVVNFAKLFNTPPRHNKNASRRDLDFRGLSPQGFHMWCAFRPTDYGSGFKGLGPPTLLDDVIVKKRGDDGIIIEERTPSQALTEARKLCRLGEEDGRKAAKGALVFINQTVGGAALDLDTKKVVSAGTLSPQMIEAMYDYDVVPYEEVKSWDSVGSDVAAQLAIGARDPDDLSERPPFIDSDQLFHPPPMPRASEPTPDDSMDVDDALSGTDTSPARDHPAAPGDQDDVYPKTMTALASKVRAIERAPEIVASEGGTYLLVNKQQREDFRRLFNFPGRDFSTVDDNDGVSEEDEFLINYRKLEALCRGPRDVGGRLERFEALLSKLKDEGIVDSVDRGVAMRLVMSENADIRLGHVLNLLGDKMKDKAMAKDAATAEYVAWLASTDKSLGIRRLVVAIPLLAEAPETIGLGTKACLEYLRDKDDDLYGAKVSEQDLRDAISCNLGRGNRSIDKIFASAKTFGVAPQDIDTYKEDGIKAAKKLCSAILAEFFGADGETVAEIRGSLGIRRLVVAIPLLAEAPETIGLGTKACLEYLRDKDDDLYGAKVSEQDLRDAISCNLGRGNPTIDKIFTSAKTFGVAPKDIDTFKEEGIKAAKRLKSHALENFFEKPVAARTSARKRKLI